MKLAVDAMGGDHAPEAPIAGAVAALAHQDQTQAVLVGRSEEIDRVLETVSPGPDLADRLAVQHASEVITSNESPARSFRRKKDSSMAQGLRLVREGEVDACVSAGNTGALMAGGLFTFGRIPGVQRPAIGGLIPTLSEHEFLLIDMGAQVDSQPENLVQNAIMGDVYVHQMLGRRRPRVGLLNIGTEAGKGNDATKGAYRRLSELEEAVNFVGNVEARSLFFGEVDVVVCDGFVGNILLKTVEGLGLSFFDLVQDEAERSLWSRLGLLMLRGRMRRLANKIDYRETGGAPLLGLNGLVVKCHGSSDERAMASGCDIAAQAVESQLIDRLQGGLERLHSYEEEAASQPQNGAVSSWPSGEGGQ